MNFKKSYYFNSFFLFLLCLFMIYSNDKYIEFFYFIHILFSLFLITTFINIYLLLSSGKEDKPIVFVPALTFHFLLIIFCEYYIFIKKVYHFNRLFFIYGLISCLCLFLFYIIMKQIKKHKFKNYSKNETYKKKAMSNKFLILIYEILYLALIILIVFIPISEILKNNRVFLNISIMFILCHFFIGFFILFLNKRYSSLFSSYYSIIKYSFFFLILLLIAFSAIYCFILFFGSETHQLKAKEVFSIKWYEILVITCSPLFLPLGAGVKYLLFDRKAQ